MGGYRSYLSWWVCMGKWAWVDFANLTRPMDNLGHYHHQPKPKVHSIVSLSQITKLHANSSVKKYFEAARFIHLAWYSHTQHVSIVLFKGIALFGIVYLDAQNTLKFICFVRHVKLVFRKHLIFSLKKLKNKNSFFSQFHISLSR